MKQLLLPGILIAALTANGQLVIQNGATFFIGENATVSVQGNVQSAANITAGGSGATLGKLLLNGTSAQTLDMGNFSIPRLEINNTTNVSLANSDAKIGNALEFTAGKLQLGSFNLTIAPGVTYTTPGTGKFIETNGTGQARQQLTADAASPVIVPVGNGTDYTPFSFTNTGSTYSSAYVGVRSTGTAVPTPTRHPRTETYLNTWWNVVKSGITGGTLTGTGTYVDGDIVGTEADLRAVTLTGSTWAYGTGQNAAGNTVSATLGANDANLYAMNRHLLVTPKVFLQGAYNSGTGLMTDAYRTNNLLPTSDPYRNAPYSTAPSPFTHVNNSVTETTVGTPFATNANDNLNIVDWVFVELRNFSSPTQAPVIQTRSAFVTKNGTIVDVDGISPVYFKNVDAGNYAFSIRHRNHLGISTNPNTLVGLSLNNTNFDFTTAAAGALFGTAGTNYASVSGKNVMYAGNAFLNTSVNYLGLNTDRAQLLQIMGNASNAPTPARNITNTSDYQNYAVGDLNFNRVVDYLGLSPDRSYLVSTVLGGSPSTPAKTQALPN